MMTYCGDNCCKECDRLLSCGGCEQCQGHPFGGSCVAERNKDFPLLKHRLINEINAFGIEGLAVTDLSGNCFVQTKIDPGLSNNSGLLLKAVSIKGEGYGKTNTAYS